MASKVISVVIGNDVTKVCEISYKKNNSHSGIRVYKSISFPTPNNTIEDGYIKQKEEFAICLKSQLKVAKISSKKVIFSIVSSKIANREVIIPLVSNKKIYNIIKTGANDYFLSIDIKDYILSYNILEKKTSDKKEKAQDKRRKKQENKLAKRQLAIDKKSKGKELKGKKSKEKISRENGANTYSEKVKLSSRKLMFNEEGVKNENDSSEKVIKKRDNKKKDRHIRLAVYAMPANIVKNYYNFAQLAGLEVVSIDCNGNSSYQMLKRQAKQGTNVFVQLNEQDTVISILRDNILILQRTVGYGISSLIETVLEQSCLKANNEVEALELLQTQDLLELQTVKKNMVETEISLSEAAATNELIGHSSIDTAAEEYQARRNIVEALSFLSNSISRMLDYYKNKDNNNVYFETIYLTGIGIRVKGIDRFFSQDIGIKSTKIEKLSTVSSSKKAKIFQRNPSEFMSCIGSVIKPVNFVPLELIERKERRNNAITSTFLILLSIGGSAVLSYFSYEDYLSARESYQVTLVQYEAMPSTDATIAENDKAAKRLENLNTMEAAMQGDQRINQVLTELQEKLLSNASIQSIEFSETGVVMSILMADNNYGANALVAKLLMQIKTIELFDVVQDSNQSVSEDGQISLTISCTYAQ